ncbi:MAG: DUF1697 domain-containing protein [Myxococcales bacterium]|nr:DUF1697 domain-containing protein [Myxococcales bacterium]
MSRLVFLLRGVNVGGARRLKMAELRGLAESLGLEQVETYLQSGNLLARGAEAPDSLAARLSEALGTLLGREAPAVFAITAKTLEARVEGNPFLARGADPATLHLTFVKGASSSAALASPGSLDPARFGPDEFALGADAIYVRCPEGYARTKLNNAFFERRLRAIATTRSWKTVEALLERAR